MSLFKSNTQTIRTRFAPSPTGYLHVGGLRTALYAYLMAKQAGGQFLVRIEDTDQSRKVDGAVKTILDALYWTQIIPDEGVMLNNQGEVVEKGKLGPYVQSKRLDIYHTYAKKLVDQGQAYYCFCSEQRLDNLRKTQQAAKQPTRYDWHCRNLTPIEVKERLKNGDPYVIRLKVPADQTLEFEDWVRGQVKISTNDIDDQVLLKSDGYPTYHLAVVVDDHLMNITHVIRGEEWLSSTPKHILLYMYFGWEVPQYLHISLTLNTDRSKLSKRQGDVAVGDYQKQGYLPAALLNFVALLGWNPGTDQEIMSLDEMIQQFDFSRIHKAGAIFDRDKLDWMNGEYIRKMSFAQFKTAVMPFLQQNFPTLPPNLPLDQFLALEQTRIVTLNQIGLEVSYLLTDRLEYDPKLLVWKKSDVKTTKDNLLNLIAELKSYAEADWLADKLEAKIIQYISDHKLSNGEVLWPMRVALTGQQKSATPFEVAAILGQVKTLSRLAQAVDLLE